MNILLDTHILLWYLEGAARLTVAQKAAISSVENKKYLSFVSLWEMTIKQSIGKLNLRTSPEGLVPNEVEILMPRTEDLSVLAQLPYHHRDPFDRMLIAQALTHQMPILTADRHFKLYEGLALI